MSTKESIEALYTASFDQFVKKMSFRVGGIPNGEDVVQEAFTRALYYAKSFDANKKELGAWFNTILNNAARDFKKEQRREGMVDNDNLTDDMDTSVFRDEMIAIVQKELNDMPEKAGEALMLFFVMGYTMKEIAQLTDSSVQSTRKAVQLFRKYMRDTYGEGMCS